MRPGCLDDDDLYPRPELWWARRDQPTRPDNVMTELQIALAAVRLYAETHPRPTHVSQTQAGEMLRMSPNTVRKLVRCGVLPLNSCGLIPIESIDAARAERTAA